LRSENKLSRPSLYRTSRLVDSLRSQFSPCKKYFRLPPIFASEMRLIFMSHQGSNTAATISYRAAVLNLGRTRGQHQKWFDLAPATQRVAFIADEMFCPPNSLISRKDLLRLAAREFTAWRVTDGCVSQLGRGNLVGEH